MQITGYIEEPLRYRYSNNWICNTTLGHQAKVSHNPIISLTSDIIVRKCTFGAAHCYFMKELFNWSAAAGLKSLYHYQMSQRLSLYLHWNQAKSGSPSSPTYLDREAKNWDRSCISVLSVSLAFYITLLCARGVIGLQLSNRSFSPKDSVTDFWSAAIRNLVRWLLPASIPACPSITPPLKLFWVK